MRAKRRGLANKEDGTSIPQCGRTDAKELGQRTQDDPSEEQTGFPHTDVPSNAAMMPQFSWLPHP